MTAQNVESLYCQHKGLIKSTIRKNRTLLTALRLEEDDVAQELSIAMLSAIEGFDSGMDVPLGAYIALKLKYAILDMKRRCKPHGITCVPHGERVSIVYLDDELPEGGTFEIPSADDTGTFEYSELLDSLSECESNVIELAARGYPIRQKAQTDALRGIRRKYSQIYKNEGSIAA